MKGKYMIEEVKTKSNNTELRKAAMYVRASTDYQKYSLENQISKIQKYADRNKIEVIVIYADKGKSGLNLHGREALKGMLIESQSEHAEFNMILVLDVSRWGRFQDADESAYYEYACRKVGIDVHYVAEQFNNNHDSISTIIKGIKRAMAAEFSRELSAKVFIGQCKVLENGFKLGGPTAYGYRRMLVDKDGNHKVLMKIGEIKNLQTDRVILIHGPEKEIEIVKWMFQSIADKKLTEYEIAKNLNKRGIKPPFSKEWTTPSVRRLLTNEKYIGNYVFNKCSFKLRKKRVLNDPSIWVRSNSAFKGIIESELFYKVQKVIENREYYISDEVLIDRLKSLYEKYGYLTAKLINSTNRTRRTKEYVPCSNTYITRFKSLTVAYELVGFKYDINLKYTRREPKISKSRKKKYKRIC
jgi:DNA invertase Pin-like site-specific DNA recombinase